MNTCTYSFDLTNVVGGVNCGAAITGVIGWTGEYVSNLARITVTRGNTNFSGRPTGCGGALVTAKMPLEIRLDGAIVATFNVAAYDAWNAIMRPVNCSITVPHDPNGLPDPNPPVLTKYACVNGSCKLSEDGIFDTLAECQEVCKHLDGKPCNCEPPSICFSPDEVQTLRKALANTRKNLLTDLLGRLNQ